MRLLVAAGVAATLLVALSAPVAADRAALERARALVNTLHFEEAQTVVAGAIAAGHLGPDDLAQLYLLDGKVCAALGDPGGARRSFRRALALAPGARLPDGASPKLVAPFEAARADLGGRRLTVRAELAPGPASTIRMIVVSDPAGLVAGGRATFRTPDGRQGTVEAAGTRVVPLPLPAADRVELRIAAVDRHGNRLAVVGARAPIVVVSRIGAPPARPWIARPVLWGAVAAGFAGVGTYYAVDVVRARRELDRLNARSDEHDFAHALAVEDRGRASARLANIGFAAAGVSALVALVLAVDGPERPPAARPVLLPAPGGASVTLSW